MTTTPTRKPLDLLLLFVQRYQGDPNKALLAPWIDGRYAYASNRHWLVRMPIEALSAEERDALPQRTPGQQPDAAGLFAAHEEAWPQAEAWAPLPAIEPPHPCAHCGGKGSLWIAKCPHCDEIGCTPSGEDCAACEGTGDVPTAAYADGAAYESCWHCWATGYHDQTVRHGLQRIEVGAGGYSQSYLYQLAQIPGLRFAPNGDEAAARFAFPLPGGHQAQGLLMPMRQDRPAPAAEAPAP